MKKKKEERKREKRKREKREKRKRKKEKRTLHKRCLVLFVIFAMREKREEGGIRRKKGKFLVFLCVLYVNVVMIYIYCIQIDIYTCACDTESIVITSPSK